MPFNWLTILEDDGEKDKHNHDDDDDTDNGSYPRGFAHVSSSRYVPGLLQLNRHNFRYNK